MKKYFFLLGLLIMNSNFAQYMTLKEFVQQNSQKPDYKRLSQEQKQFERDLFELISFSKQLIILKFFATWCGPCKLIAPIVKEIHEQFIDDVIIIEIDADLYPQLRGAFGVRAFPTFIYYQNGRELEKHHTVSKEVFAEKITKYLY